MVKDTLEIPIAEEMLEELTWRYRYATLKQLESAWEIDEIRLAFQHDLSFTEKAERRSESLPQWEFPCDLGFTFFGEYNRKKFMSPGNCHWMLRGSFLSARYLWPKLEWLAIQGNTMSDGGHSTVICVKKNLVFDPYFQYIKVPAHETVTKALDDGFITNDPEAAEYNELWI